MSRNCTFANKSGFDEVVHMHRLIRIHMVCCIFLTYRCHPCSQQWNHGESLPDKHKSEWDETYPNRLHDSHIVIKFVLL